MTSRTRLGLAMAIIITSFAAGGAHADEKGLIWKPVKNSDQSYTTRIGAKIPTSMPIRAGLEMGLNASKGGDLVDTPVRLWGTVTLLAEQLPGVTLARDVGVLMNAITGSGTVSVTSSQKRIATSELDFEANRNVTVRYDGTSQQWSGMDVSQSLRLTRSQTGTAFVLTGASRDTFNEFSTGVAVEQRLGDHLTLSGTLNQGYEDHFRPGVSARYNIRW
jgi:hypothetical protein